MEIATATYDELKKARDEINQRLKEIERDTIQELEARAQKFGFSLIKNGTQQPSPKSKVKYRDPNGNTWAGRGRKPEWAQSIINSGGDIEDYRI